MTDSQKANMMEARVFYIKKIGELLLERQELRIKLQVGNDLFISLPKKARRKVENCTEQRNNASGKLQPRKRGLCAGDGFDSGASRHSANTHSPSGLE